MDDWHAIYDVLVRYAHAVDARDFEAAGECFAPDARATHAGVVRLRGLRYLDRLERRDGQWRIVERVHEPVWTAEAPAIA